MYNVIFLEETVNEIEVAAKWYAERQDGLDIRFKENVLSSIEQLHSDRIIYRTVYRKLSRVLVKKFPHIIYFRKDIERRQIIILGVLHEKQSKANIDKRL